MRSPNKSLNEEASKLVASTEERVKSTKDAIEAQVAATSTEAKNALKDAKSATAEAITIVEEAVAEARGIDAVIEKAVTIINSAVAKKELGFAGKLTNSNKVLQQPKIPSFHAAGVEKIRENHIVVQACNASKESGFLSSEKSDITPSTVPRDTTNSKIQKIVSSNDISPPKGANYAHPSLDEGPSSTHTLVTKTQSKKRSISPVKTIKKRAALP